MPSKLAGRILLLLAAGCPPVQAAICALDQAPAATLLIPWFGEDLAACDAGAPEARRHTEIDVSNAGAVPVRIGITYWTDAARPVHRSSRMLDAHASLRIQPREALCAEPARSRIRGAASGAQCHGFAAADERVEGYVTIDVLDADPAALAIDDPAYFSAAWLGDANVLHGSFRLHDREADSAVGFAAVALEADAALAAAPVTFYRRYNGDGSDAREPLPTTYATRSLRGGAFGDTFLFAWRESDGALGAFDCSAGPPGFPLLETNATGGLGRGIVMIPERGDAAPVLQDLLFPRATQRISRTDRIVHRGAGHIEFGTLLVNLQHDGTALGAGYGQAWVGSAPTADGRFAYGRAGMPLDASCAQGPTPWTPPPRFVE